MHVVGKRQQTDPQLAILHFRLEDRNWLSEAATFWTYPILKHLLAQAALATNPSARKARRSLSGRELRLVNRSIRDSSGGTSAERNLPEKFQK